MKPLTWRELRNKIDEMPESSIDDKIIALGENIPPSDVFLECQGENMYVVDDCEYLTPESELEVGDKYELSIKKGTFNLYI